MAAIGSQPPSIPGGAPPSRADATRPAEPGRGRARLSSRHVPALDGVRGIAVIAVMLFHFVPRDGLFAAETALSRVTEPGWAGVDLFFVLSGYLITGLLLDDRESPHYFRNFYARRILRIFPLYYAVVIARLLLPLFVKVPGLDDSPGSAPYLLTYTSNLRMVFGAGFLAVPVGTGHFWSLAIEEQFYLIWPLAVRRLRPAQLLKVALACIGVAGVARIAIRVWTTNDLAPYMLLPTRMDALAVGAVIALAVRNDRWYAVLRRTWAPVAAAAAVVLAIVVALKPHHYFSAYDAAVQSFGYLPLALLSGALVFRAASERPTMLTSALSMRWLREMGRYSYALYIFHVPVQHAWHSLVDPRLQSLYRGWSPTAIQVSSIVLESVISIALAYASYHLFERHFLRLKVFFRTRGTATSGSAPTPVMAAARPAAGA